MFLRSTPTASIPSMGGIFSRPMSTPAILARMKRMASRKIWLSGPACSRPKRERAMPQAQRARKKRVHIWRKFVLEPVQHFRQRFRGSVSWRLFPGMAGKAESQVSARGMQK